MRRSYSSQAGSALIMILVGITLFAALSYTAARMMSGGDNAVNISEEKAGIYASEIFSYARNMRQAIQDMRISNGCEDTDISFEKTPFDGSDANYVNASSPSDFSCHVFHPDGGAVTYQAPETKWLNSTQSSGDAYGEWYFSSTVRVDKVGTMARDLVMILPWISDNLCNVINERLNLSVGSNEEDSDLDLSATEFTGTYPSSSFTIGDDVDVLDGILTACDRDDSDNIFFYQVLIAR